jgi:hypothetical protein
LAAEVEEAAGFDCVGVDAGCEPEPDDDEPDESPDDDEPLDDEPSEEDDDADESEPRVDFAPPLLFVSRESLR